MSRLTAWYLWRFPGLRRKNLSINVSPDTSAEFRIWRVSNTEQLHKSFQMALRAFWEEIFSKAISVLLERALYSLQRRTVHNKRKAWFVRCLRKPNSCAPESCQSKLFPDSSSMAVTTTLASDQIHGWQLQRKADNFFYVQSKGFQRNIYGL